MNDLYARLFSAYGAQGWWPAETPFEVMVGAVLTQNTTWIQVERVIDRLRAADLLRPAPLVELRPQRGPSTSARRANRGSQRGDPSHSPAVIPAAISPCDNLSQGDAVHRSLQFMPETTRGPHRAPQGCPCHVHPQPL